MKAKISVVIPVYNSYYSIEEVVNRTIDTIEDLDCGAEIILVDDFSRDESLSKLHQLEKRDERIRVIALPKNQGQQGAIKIGMGSCTGDYVVTIDDDLEHQPEDIKLLMEEIQKGYDVVYAVSRKDKYPVYRKLGSSLVRIFFTVFFRKPAHIKVGSFRMMNGTIASQIVRDKTPFVYITAISLKITNNIGNVECKHVERKYGNSNYNIFKLAKLFMRLLYYYA